MPRMTCYTYTCLCPPSGFSCNQKNLSYISYVSVLFRGAHAPTKPCYDTSLRIRSLSGCLCVHEDPSFVCTYSVGLSACGVVCPHFGGTIGDEELPRSAVAPPSATLSYGMPVPVPLSKLTRAYLSCGCFHVLTSGLTAEAAMLVTPWRSFRAKKGQNHIGADGRSKGLRHNNKCQV